MIEADDPKKYPAQIATYHGAGAIWFLDKAAASELTNPTEKA